ncbi:MAG: hypothetical protein CVU97_00670 [Firmicutes bacterium HGW-Firmicutes-21]|nr:MAG: hypothetical protein CVU97_00670 [Firmicutes bacterium HGW-Firmicutes-21]
MQKTKRIALLMVICMLVTLGGVFPASVVEAAVTPISNVEPAILATVGTAVTLSNYSVQLDDATVLSPSDITWYNGANVITSFNPSSKGVTVLTAKKTSNNAITKNIYVVAKLSTESEYVLYYNDFSSASAIDDWNKIVTTAGVYTVSGGKLTISGLSAGNPRIYLPSWLSDFGNYRIDTVGTQTNPTDSSRWFSMIFRAQNSATTGTPYYHMCVRNNMMAGATATTGGIECVSFNGSWNYYKSASYTEAVNASKNYTFSILAKNSVLQYQVNGDTVIHLDNLPSINPSNKGGIGLQANSSNFVVDSIKVTIQESAPVPPPEAPVELYNVRQPESNTLNHVTNIGVIESASQYNNFISKASKAPATVIFYANGSNLTNKNGDAVCSLSTLINDLSEDIFIPAFYVNDTATVNTIILALKAALIKDALFISTNPDIVKYARQNYSVVRGAVDFSGINGATLSDEQLLEIRGDVNKSLSLIAILPAKFAVKSYVQELQLNAVTVWVMDDKLTGNASIAKLITSGANGIITNNFTVVETALTTMFVANSMTRTPIIIGHRGNPSQAPENSISGYLKAIENGADVVETDIKLTKDGKVVIMHDGTIDRTTTGTGDVTAMTLDQLKQFNLWGPNDMFKNQYPNEKIPTLEEMFIAVKPTNAKIFVEIKTNDPNIVQPMVNLIKQYDMESRVTVICFDGNQLIKTKQLLPTMSTGYLLNAIDQTSSITEALVAMTKQLSFIQPVSSTLNVNAGNQNRFFAKVAGDRGITIWPWTYSNAWPSVFNSHYLLGLDGLTTDDAQYAKNMVKNIYTDKNTILLAGNGSTGSYNLSSITYGDTETNITSDSKTFIKVLEGENLITVNNGTVTATASSGRASFMLGYTTSTAAGSTYVVYTQPITVILGFEGGLELTSSSDYVIGDYLTGVTDKTNLSTLLGNFELSENIIVLDKNGTKITSPSAYIGTGCKVMYMQGEDILDEITVVVFGDANGDGIINSADYLFTKRGFLGTLTLTPLQLKACCLENTSIPTTKDYLKIKRHFLGSFNIFA